MVYFVDPRYTRAGIVLLCAFIDLICSVMAVYVTNKLCILLVYIIYILLFKNKCTILNHIIDIMYETMLVSSYGMAIVFAVAFERTFIIQYAQDLVIQEKEKDDTINTSFSTVGFKHDLLVYHNYWALFCLQLCLDKGELNCMYYLQRINSLLGYDQGKLNCMCSLQRIEGSILDYGRQASGKSSESKHSERLGYVSLASTR